VGGLRGVGGPAVPAGTRAARGRPVSRSAWRGRAAFPRFGPAQGTTDVHSLAVPTTSGACRARSAAFAASAVGLTLGAHVTAHGEPPGVPFLLLVVALVEALSSTFARRPRGPVATAAALLMAQVVLHVAFVLAAPAHAVHGEHLSSRPMLVAHGIAAVVLAVLLSRGERLITHVARLFLPVALLRPFRPVAVSRLVVAASSHVPLRLKASLHDISRRGPPSRPLAART
jgi:hypothetical protein